jgi:uncharacterized protein YjdB
VADSTVTAAAGPDNTLQLRVVDANGDDITGTATYASSDATKATVSAGGVVTGVAAGTSTITATYATPSGNRTDTQVVTVV